MMKANVLAKGYVMPYQASSFIVLPVLFLIGLTIMRCTVLSDSPILFILILAALCCMITPLGLTLDNTAMRYQIHKDSVQSRDLIRKRCHLEDDHVKQIELTLTVGYHGLYRLMADNDTPFLICSDDFYKHDDRISLSYHRKHQVAVRITRKNFPQVQAYLARMGVAAGVTDYDALVRLLRYHHNTYRHDGGAWTLQ